MDIASLSTSLAQERIADQVGTKVLKMALGVAEGEGTQLLQLLTSVETVSDPMLGSLVDTSA